MSAAVFTELKEEINKYQRALQAAAEEESTIPAGTPLVEVPARLVELLETDRVEILLMRTWARQFLHDHDKLFRHGYLTPSVREAMFHAFGLEEFAGSIRILDRRGPR